MRRIFAVLSSLAFVVPILFANSPTLADKAGKRCTKTSTSCYDKVSNKARTCVTETCTYADGTSTTSVTVELQGGGGGGGGSAGTTTVKPIEKLPGGTMTKQP
jgi:hypothetical protein